MLEKLEKKEERSKEPKLNCLRLLLSEPLIIQCLIIPCLPSDSHYISHRRQKLFSFISCIQCASSYSVFTPIAEEEYWEYLKVL